MTCTHTDRPNVLSLPSMGNPHCCRECWDSSVSKFFDGLITHRDGWETGSDYTRSGDSLWYDSTRGRVLISGNYRTFK